MQEVAERLRHLRESVKLSQMKMAEVVGVKQSSLNRYELNQASPTFETLLRYADFFDVSLDYIFVRTDTNTGPELNKAIRQWKNLWKCVLIRILL